MKYRGGDIIILDRASSILIVVLYDTATGEYLCEGSLGMHFCFDAKTIESVSTKIGEL